MIAALVNELYDGLGPGLFYVVLIAVLLHALALVIFILFLFETSNLRRRPRRREIVFNPSTHVHTRLKTNKQPIHYPIHYSYTTKFARIQAQSTSPSRKSQNHPEPHPLPSTCCSRRHVRGLFKGRKSP